MDLYPSRFRSQSHISDRMAYRPEGAADPGNTHRDFQDEKSVYTHPESPPPVLLSLFPHYRLPLHSGSERDRQHIRSGSPDPAHAALYLQSQKK